MKTLRLFAMMSLVATGISYGQTPTTYDNFIVEQDYNRLYIAQPGPDGQTSRDLADSTQWTRMYPNADGTLFTANNVEIQSAILFVAFNVNNEEPVYYSLASWAQTPIVEGVPNPLSIAATSDIPIKAGTYDVSFTPRDYTGVNFHTFTVTPVEQSELTKPEKLYMVPVSGTAIELPADLTEAPDGGFYKAYVTLPGDFQISNQIKAEEPFIYGPVTATNNQLIGGHYFPIAFQTNTSTVFTYQTSRSVQQQFVLAQGMEAYVEVNTNSDPNTLLIYPKAITAVDELNVNAATESYEYYNLNGQRIEKQMLNKGVYVQRNVDTGACRKLVY